MTPIEPQVGKFYNSPVALGAGSSPTSRSSGWRCRRTPRAARTTRPRSPATTRETELQKIASTSWIEEGGPAVSLLENMQFSNDDQNLVAKYIAEDGMSAEDAAAKWIEDNPDKVDAWLG